MFRNIFIPVFLLLSLAGIPQDRSKSANEPLQKYIYIVKQGFKKEELYTYAYSYTSIFHNNDNIRISECDFWGRSEVIKKQTLEILAKYIAHLAYDGISGKVRISISFLPQYRDKMADVWFIWKGVEKILTEEEMDMMRKELLLIQPDYLDEDNRNATPYCQILSFTILPKDWEYILNLAKLK